MPDCSSSGYLCDQERRPLAVYCRRGIFSGMSFEPDYPDSLELIGPRARENSGILDGRINRSG